VETLNSTTVGAERLGRGARADARHALYRVLIEQFVPADVMGTP